MFSHSVTVDSAATWTVARQASLSFLLSRSLLKLMFIESVMPSNHLILFCTFSSCPQSFPASGSFPVSQFFTSGGQTIQLCISPSNEYSGLISFRIDCFHLLLSKGGSKVFSSSTIQKHQFFHTEPSLWYNLHIHQMSDVLSASLIIQKHFCGKFIFYCKKIILYIII